MGNSIGNIGVLDLTSATEESVRGISSIGNVGIIICSSGNTKLVSLLNIGNIGSLDEVPIGCKFVHGKIEMNGKYFESIKEPISLFVAGQVIIKKDVTKEDIENKIGFLGIKGQVICPEKLTGALESKCNKIKGQLIPYSNNYHISTGKVDIDNSFLKSLEEKTLLIVIGKASVVDDIDTALFDEKIENIEIIGKALIKEKYSDLLKNKFKLQSGLSCKLEVIPYGYSYIDDDIYIDSLTIKKFNHVNIYAAGMLRFGNDITDGMLHEHIEAIKTKDIIVCNNKIREAVLTLCDASSQILDYSGKVTVIDSEHTIMQSELKYSPEKISYIVHGDLKVDSEVLPETFIEKVESIDNFGDITCSKEHYGLVQLKLRTNDGDVSIIGDKNSGEGCGIGNIGYLKL